MFAADKSCEECVSEHESISQETIYPLRCGPEQETIMTPEKRKEIDEISCMICAADNCEKILCRSCVAKIPRLMKDADNFFRKYFKEYFEYIQTIQTRIMPAFL